MDDIKKFLDSYYNRQLEEYIKDWYILLNGKVWKSFTIRKWKNIISFNFDKNIITETWNILIYNYVEIIEKKWEFISKIIKWEKVKWYSTGYIILWPTQNKKEKYMVIWTLYTDNDWVSVINWR